MKRDLFSDNWKQSLRYRRRNWLRRLQLAYAGAAVWIPCVRPDFMCIGAPRAATTWLHSQLSTNPRIFLPRAKELHFFDEAHADAVGSRTGLRWHRAYYFDVESPAHQRWYSLQFRGADGRLKGDITPQYSILSRDRVAVIGQQMPALRIIYILRNPIDRAWSGLRKSAWYQKGGRFLEAQGEEWIQNAVMQPDVLARGNYPKTIGVWNSVFPKEQIHYVFHDDVIADPVAALRGIHTFLGLDPALVADRAAVSGKVNAAPAFGMPKSVRKLLGSHYAPQIEFLERYFCRDLQHWL